jgi:hypothetical protein
MPATLISQDILRTIFKDEGPQLLEPLKTPPAARQISLSLFPE